RGAGGACAAAAPASPPARLGRGRPEREAPDRSASARRVRAAERPSPRLPGGAAWRSGGSRRHRCCSTPPAPRAPSRAGHLAVHGEELVELAIKREAGGGRAPARLAHPRPHLGLATELFT